MIPGEHYHLIICFHAEDMKDALRIAGYIADLATIAPHLTVRCEHNGDHSHSPRPPQPPSLEMGI